MKKFLDFIELLFSKNGEIISSVVLAFSAITTWVIRKKKRNRFSLTNHNLFSLLKFYTLEIKSMNFIDDHKTEIGRTMLKDKIDDGIIFLKKYALYIDENHKKISHSEAREILHDSIVELVNSYTEKWIYKQIPEAAIKAFTSYHSHNIDYIIKLSTMEFSNTNKSVLLCARKSLDYLREAYVITFSDVEKVINDVDF
jgi:hypothetical protein